MRVLIDYRPALRARSGVGEYVHQLVAALASPSAQPNGVEITIFSSSWKDRLSIAPELNGTSAVDLRIPVSILNRLWHRIEWPVGCAGGKRRQQRTDELMRVLAHTTALAQCGPIVDQDTHLCKSFRLSILL